MKKTILGLNIFLVLLILIGDLCYIRFSGIALKSSTSITFAVLGGTNLIYARRQGLAHPFPAAMVIALTTAMIGDIALWFSFELGAILFALAHALYFAAYCIHLHFEQEDLFVCGATVLLSAIVLLFPIYDFGSSFMKWICYVYALIISFMLGKAGANLLRQRDRTNFLIFLGSILFYISDLMLLLCVFAGAHPITDTICLITYYPAQCLLGHAIYSFVQKEKNHP